MPNSEQTVASPPGSKPAVATPLERPAAPPEGLTPVAPEKPAVTTPPERPAAPPEGLTPDAPEKPAVTTPPEQPAAPPEGPIAVAPEKPAVATPPARPTAPPEGPIAVAPGQLPIRGALRFEIKTSSPEIQAGSDFSLFAEISNPFETEVRIDSVSCIIPVEFEDVGKHRRELRAREKQLREAVTPEPTERTPPPGLPFGLGGLGRSADRTLAATSRVALAVRDEQEISADQGDASEAVLSSVTLQPGDTAIQHFELRTTRWLLFQPATYNLPITIAYTLAGRKHRDIVEFRLSIRAPLKAVMCGAGLGAFLGFLLHDLLNDRTSVAIWTTNVHGFWSLFPALAAIVFAASASILGAALTIVAFARKRDAQPFITVEDFLGGMFVGTVIGYGGQNLLQGLLPSNPASPPHP